MLCTRNVLLCEIPRRSIHRSIHLWNIFCYRLLQLGPDRELWRLFCRVLLDNAHWRDFGVRGFRCGSFTVSFETLTSIRCYYMYYFPSLAHAHPIRNVSVRRLMPCYLPM